MQRRDPKPEIQRLEELAIAVKSGDIKLPKFQRPFVWKRTDMLNLLDSIYKGYPIGSLLMWNSSQRLTSERSISGLELNDRELTSYPTNYLLDGQQRLTTLCGALFWHGKELVNHWNIHFNLESEEFVYPDEPDLVHLFPLNKLIETSDFIKQCMKFEHHDRGVVYTRNAEKLLRAIKDYKIAVVKIGDMTVEEVAPIFERINSTGRKLTIVDLMMAATWSDDFDLNQEIQLIIDSAEAAGLAGVKDQIVLRSISAAAGLGINKDDIQRLRKIKPAQLKEATASVREAVGKTAAFLTRRLSVFDFSRLPYAMQFTHLVEIFRIQQSVDRDLEREILGWLWFTTVTRYFTSSNSGQNSKDLAKVRDFARGLNGNLYARDAIDATGFFCDKFNLRNSTSTGFSLLLASRQPEMTVDGRSIDPMYLRVKESKYYSSIIDDGSGLSKSNIARIIHPYPDRPCLGDGAEIRQQHFLPETPEYASVYDFLTERGGIIAGYISQVTGCEVSFTLGAIDGLGYLEDDWIVDDGI
ncbi:DUF262 domain-containing protein [Lysobacter enzymogenes]|uniref:DUF262 domain-containing protein n=1 Tax=Lysobacter enzymogenes TaxID=69 RepID=UPI001AF9674A|nr:DUF262 domain-containing protein [Lysobacter enzymogenes]QQQ01890.1 DUF262 domain-containing protein [Lysobacter enzymogenes]